MISKVGSGYPTDLYPSDPTFEIILVNLVTNLILLEAKTPLQFHQDPHQDLMHRSWAETSCVHGYGDTVGDALQKSSKKPG